MNLSPTNNKERSRRSSILRTIFLSGLLLSLAGSLFAGNVTFFGPKQYNRDKGKPVTVSESFSCLPQYAGAGFTLRLTTGGGSPVSSAVITLNGVRILKPSDFNRQVETIERSVDVAVENEISVKLNGKPGSHITLEIVKFILPPQVQFSATPETINYQQSSTLNWQVSNADTLFIDKNIGNVSATGSHSVSPEVPTTTYTLTAVNLGGSTGKQVTVTVNFPVPTVSLNVEPQIIRPGVSSTLSWTSFAAHTVTIDPGIGSVAANGSLTLSPASTTTYTITATGYGGSGSTAAILTVDGAPPGHFSERTGGRIVPKS